jgi:hypothetical protein
MSTKESIQEPPTKSGHDELEIRVQRATNTEARQEALAIALKLDPGIDPMSIRVLYVSREL